MSKEFKNIDDLFQSSFADDVAEVPAFVKTNIDKRLGFGGKNRFVWLLPFVLLISFGAIATIYLASDSVETTFTQPISQEKNKTVSNQSADGDKEAINDTSSNNGNTINSTSSSYTNNSISLEKTNSITQTNLTKPFTLSSQIQNVSNEFVAEEGSTIKNSETENTIINDPIVNIQSEGNSSENNVKSQEENTTENNINTEEGIATLNNETTQEEIIANNNQTPQEKNTTENSDSSKTQTTDSEILSVDTTSDNSSPQIPITNSEPKYNPWMLSLTGGLNLSKSAYSSTTQTEVDLYKNSTNEKTGFETNFEVKYRLNNSLTFGSGLGITQFVENYTFSKSTYQYDSTLTWTYVYDSLDTTLFPPPIDSSYTATYDSSSVNLYNESGQTKGIYASIPLSIGSQIIYNKFRFEFFAAGRFNYLVSSSGGYILNDAFVPFTKASNPIFKPWYFDMLLGASVHYNLIGKLYISGTFRYRPPIGQMYQGTTFNRSVQYTHIGLGLSLKF